MHHSSNLHFIPTINLKWWCHDVTYGLTFETFFKNPTEYAITKWKVFIMKKKNPLEINSCFERYLLFIFFYSIACYDLRFRNSAIALLEIRTGTNSNCMGISLSSDIASGASNLADSLKKSPILTSFTELGSSFTSRFWKNLFSNAVEYRI